ncbi:MAG TPA: EAL domain-containing protein, partial [Rhizomicrobium sp.]|nr:EAL domain-containing protein [Rhizomicrobium sp.]
YARKSDKRAVGRDLAQLRRLTMEFDQQLHAAGRRMDDISRQIDAKSDAQSRKIVAELQMLEGLMRNFAGKISGGAMSRQNDVQQIEAVPSSVTTRSVPQLAPAPAALAQSVTGERGLLETVRLSLEDNRLDLYLQPIVSLPQRKLRYYEALTRLRSEDGKVIMPAQYIKVATPAGLMSVVDNLLLFRCVQVVRRLTQKNREIAVFCNISGDTLGDGEFFPQFLDYMRANRDLAGQIVFEFAQAAVLKAGPEGERNLRTLAGLGFSLSMDHVETLVVDFPRLKNIGFGHIKLRAHTLTHDMANAGAAVAAEDFKKLLSRHGLNLIVERVEDEKTVLQLLDFNVDFAQGFLFGEPRAVRDEAQKPVQAGAAPAAAVPFKRAG